MEDVNRVAREATVVGFGIFCVRVSSGANLYTILSSHLSHHQACLHGQRGCISTFARLLSRNDFRRTTGWKKHPDVLRLAPLYDMHRNNVFLRNKSGRCQFQHKRLCIRRLFHRYLLAQTRKIGGSQTSPGYGGTWGPSSTQQKRVVTKQWPQRQHHHNSQNPTEGADRGRAA